MPTEWTTAQDPTSRQGHNVAAVRALGPRVSSECVGLPQCVGMAYFIRCQSSIADSIPHELAGSVPTAASSLQQVSFELTLQSLHIFGLIICGGTWTRTWGLRAVALWSLVAHHERYPCQCRGSCPAPACLENAYAIHTDTSCKQHLFRDTHALDTLFSDTCTHTRTTTKCANPQPFQRISCISGAPRNVGHRSLRGAGCDHVRR